MLSVKEHKMLMQIMQSSQVTLSLLQLLNSATVVLNRLHVNKWSVLCLNKTLFSKTSGGSHLVVHIQFAYPCTRMQGLRAGLMESNHVTWVRSLTSLCFSSLPINGNHKDVQFIGWLGGLTTLMYVKHSRQYMALSKHINKSQLLLLLLSGNRKS